MDAPGSDLLVAAEPSAAAVREDQQVDAGQDDQQGGDAGAHDEGHAARAARVGRAGRGDGAGAPQGGSAGPGGQEGGYSLVRQHHRQLEHRGGVV